jgi:hypothetical protein
MQKKQLATFGFRGANLYELRHFTKGQRNNFINWHFFYTFVENNNINKLQYALRNRMEPLAYIVFDR